ncbi:hypothetical protein MMC09_001779 [Bachmanniomyces sp. S44760]|nr:hypothetical protein [Bachmanniomyces sp. S44760]
MAVAASAGIAAGTSLVSALSQTLTNGLSVLGTLQAPVLPDFLTSNPLPDGFPWGTDTASNTDPYTQSPVTGVIRPYDFTIKRGYIQPDGVNKSVILINGQFPGPTIEANWGDTIQVVVHNKLTAPEEGTSLHWHGILQKETPWYDGVPSVQQCPIAPGSSFTYTFKADLYGTSWYHSHYSAQYAGGLLGPMIIHGPKHVPYDVDLGPIFLTDYYHTEYFNLVEQVMAPNSTGPFKSDNNLINGKMDFNCSNAPPGVKCTSNAGLAKFQFKTGKTHRLRLINAGAEGIQRFTIDNHTMTVIANDFVPVKPYSTSVVTLGIGQRTDILVTANAAPNAAVWMRSDLSAACALANQPHALAAIYYPKADTTVKPTTTATPYDDSHCGNDPLSSTVPIYPIKPATVPATQETIDITIGQNASFVTLWKMNNSSFRADYNSPLLLLANQGNTSYPYSPEWNVYNFGSNTSYRLIVQNHVGAAHPMHLHGHNFHVLAEGTGTWNGVVTNPTNTQRRDVQLLQPSLNANTPGYIVLQISADNPGVWPFHCHIAWHVSAGLYVNIMERPSDITERQIPSVLQQTCTDWDAYTSKNSPDEIDSGL